MSKPHSGVRRAAAALLAAGLALPALSPAHAQPDSKWDPKQLVTPPLRRVQVPKPERYTLPSGMVVFLLENHDLPRVTGRVVMKSSPLWIPDDRVGLAAVTGQAIRSGGSPTHSGDWLDDRLAAIGASISSDISNDLASAGFRCLSDDVNEVVGLFADILRHPAFPEDKIELARVGLRRDIASRNDEMIPLLVRVSQQAVFGKGNPYARQPEYATVEAIQPEDCVQLHRRVFDPGRMVLAVYGDFRAAAMKKLLAATLGDWKGAREPLPPAPPLPGPVQPRLVFAPKEDVTQSGIILAHLGFRADDPDYPPMDVFQMALGGGFQSRLVNRIRTERGLAYASGAGAGEGYQRPGVFIAYSLTRGDSTMVALDLLREEVRKAVEAPFTDEELRTAKQSVQNIFVFNFEDPAEVLFRASYYEAIGYPQDFLDRCQKGLEGVTAASVLEAARRKVHPEAMLAVVVGKEKDFDRSLDSAGIPVERVDIAIPPPPSKARVGAATPEALAKGREWLERAAELAGGRAAFAEVRSVVSEQDIELTIQGQPVQLTGTSSWALPDRVRVQLTTPMGEIVQACDGKQGWVSQMGQVQDDPKRAESVRQQYERSLFRLFGQPGQLQVQALDAPREVDGKPYRVAFVKSETVPDWFLLFDADGRLARMEYQGTGQTGPVSEVQVLEDWRSEGRIQLPHATRAFQDGKLARSSKVKAYRINAELADTLFRKPAP